MTPPRIVPRVRDALAAAAIGAYIDLVRATTRWRFEGREHLSALEARDHGFILAFWHCRLLLAPAIRRESARPGYMLISQHRDGALIARAVARFGIRFIRGSAANPNKPGVDKGGGGALMQMVAAIESGGIVGMTPDGPRGPARRVNPGVIRLAALTGAPILAGAYSTSLGWRLNTWDRFLLPAPFSAGAFVAEPPLAAPPRHADAETVAAACRALEATLDRAAARADRLVGRAPETQAPSPQPPRIG